MNEIIELDNRVDGGRRLLHLMANRELNATDLIGYWPPEDAMVQVSREGGAWHLRAAWAHVEVVAGASGREYVLTEIRNGERISEAVRRAVGDYLRRFGHGPQYAYLARLPKGVRIGYAIRCQGWELFLLQAEWVPVGQVAVGEPGARVDCEEWTAEVLSAPMVLA